MKPYQTEVPATRVKVRSNHGRTGSSSGPTIPATVVPDNNVPNRKWFAAAAGLVVVNGAAALGLDIGAFVVELADQVGLDVSEAEAEAEIRSAIGALAGAYVWPEWLTLPEFVRSALRKLTKPLRRG